VSPVSTTPNQQQSQNNHQQQQQPNYSAFLNNLNQNSNNNFNINKFDTMSPNSALKAYFANIGPNMGFGMNAEQSVQYHNEMSNAAAVFNAAAAANNQNLPFLAYNPFMNSNGKLFLILILSFLFSILWVFVGIVVLIYKSGNQSFLVFSRYHFSIIIIKFKIPMQYLMKGN
jgi:hypothetical protein